MPLRDRASRPRLEFSLSVFAILITLSALIMFFRHMVGNIQELRLAERHLSLAHAILFSLCVGVLVYGNLVYQLTRIGHYLRRGRFSHPPFQEVFNQEPPSGLPSLTILVPSYKEDPRTIRQTLLSAALQDYPGRRVVLLIDDSPNPTDPADRALLESARAMPDEIMALLEPPRERAERARRWFWTRQELDEFDPVRELRELRAAYGEADAWFAQQLEWGEQRDHTDRFFGHLVYRMQRALLRQSQEWPVRNHWRGTLTPSEIAHHYNRLVGLFTVEIASFERKRYVNLAHEPNKAANLNSYIGLIGAHLTESRRAGELHLERVDDADLLWANVHIPDAKYVITLDADSMIAPDYARRMVAIMEAPGNERVAVSQSPYTPIPDPPGIVERIAGATTSLQYLVQQGSTHYASTFWIGANALLRREALEDIKTFEEERGFQVPKFIQDRTVIEDTESTIDLVARGWSLFNYPERLAFSATPPDFGSLLIQRRRWSTGGLLIMPKLLKYAFSRPLRRGRSVEVALRTHYLISSVYSTVCLLFFLMLPNGDGFNNLWLPLTGAPYFLIQWRELMLAGYKRADVLRVYAFNLMLIPIQMAGIINSIQQATTGRKIPFGRTPKVEGHTAAPAWAIGWEVAFVLYFIGLTAYGIDIGQWTNALFALEIAIAFTYAIVAFIGPKAALNDVTIGLRQRTARLTRRTKRRVAPAPMPSWPAGLEPALAIAGAPLRDDAAVHRYESVDLRSMHREPASGHLSHDRFMDLEPAGTLIASGSRPRELAAAMPVGD